MGRIFPQVSRASLEALAGQLRSGRLGPPYRLPALLSCLPPQDCAEVLAQLQVFASEGLSPCGIARLVEAIVEERLASQKAEDRLQMVWSPPALDQVDARDTASVIRELFESAQTSVDIVTYALDTGDKAKAIFGRLAEHFDRCEDFGLRLFVDIRRPFGDTAPLEEHRQAFWHDFQRKIWPGSRLPSVFYDPRSLGSSTAERSSLHAKAVLVDRRLSFLTSANFTQAAHQRNIEAGVLIRDPAFTQAMIRQLDGLIEKGHLCPLTTAERQACVGSLPSPETGVAW